MICCPVRVGTCRSSVHLLEREGAHRQEGSLSRHPGLCLHGPESREHVLTSSGTEAFLRSAYLPC